MGHDAGRAARPTTYKNVRMRSRLEAGFATWCDRIGITWEYEPECFASELGQYLPDFRVTGLVDFFRGKQVDHWIEVKPYAQPDADVRRWSDILAANRPNDTFVVATPKGFTGRLYGVDVCPELHFVAWPSKGFTPSMKGPWDGEWWKGDQLEPTLPARPAWPVGPPPPMPPRGAAATAKAPPMPGGAAEARKRLQARQEALLAERAAAQGRENT